MRFKYIIIEKRGEERPIIFSKFLDHAFVRDCVHARYPGIPVISAGFVRFEGDKVIAEGQSIGLRLKSRPEDTQIIIADGEFEV